MAVLKDSEKEALGLMLETLSHYELGFWSLHINEKKGTITIKGPIDELNDTQAMKHEMRKEFPNIEFHESRFLWEEIISLEFKIEDFDFDKFTNAISKLFHDIKSRQRELMNGHLKKLMQGIEKSTATD